MSGPTRRSSCSRDRIREPFIHRNERVAKPGAAEQANRSVASRVPQRRAPRRIARELAQAIGELGAVARLMKDGSALCYLGGPTRTAHHDCAPTRHRLSDDKAERLWFRARVYRNVQRPQHGRHVVYLAGKADRIAQPEALSANA